MVAAELTASELGDELILCDAIIETSNENKTR